MATNTKHLGKEGFLYFSVTDASGNTPPIQKLAKITGYELTIKADEVDASDHDSGGWGDKLDGYKDWSATVDVNYVDGDGTQEALLGAMINSLDVQSEFRKVDGVGQDNRKGTARVTNFGESVKGATMQTQSFTLSGRGPLTLGTVAAG